MAKGEKNKDKPRGGKIAGFALDDPKLPEGIKDAALASGGYPYDAKLKRGDFEDELRRLQIELVKLQFHLAKSRDRLLVVFEGRDSAGKGSCIGRFREHLNPRNARAVALAKPTETERGQWYFQRYAAQMPTAGEIVLFDRSWYNRAGVERVMGFADANQVADFLREAPQFEGMLARDGIRVFKIYLEIGREMQLMRFHERRHDPLKRWKISDMDLAAIELWDEYTEAKEDMFRFTHTADAPWHVILANDQRRARLEAIRLVLQAMTYDGKDARVIGESDARIVGAGPAFFARPR
jgi:polyphosphate kinase 2